MKALYELQTMGKIRNSFSACKNFNTTSNLYLDMKKGIVFVLLIVTQFCYGQTVVLDTTYAVSGIRDSINPFNFNSFGIASKLKVLQNNASIALITYDNPNKGMLVKLTSTGQYDNSFGTNGKVFFSSTGPDFKPIELIIQPDNKILAIGLTPPTQVRVFRFLSNGAPDITFGANGEASLFPLHDLVTPQGACILPNGKIIICGSVTDFSVQFPFPKDMVICLNPNGTLDNSFSNAGMAIASYTFNNFTSSYKGVAALTNNQIVLTGFSAGFSGFSLLVSKLDANGAVVNGFGTAGHFLNSSVTHELEGYEVGVQSNGEIVVVGLEKNLTSNQKKGFVLGLNADGTLNNSFGNAGKYSILSTFNSYPSSLVLQNNGKINILAVNADTSDLTDDHSIYRINPNGTSDSSFNSTGEKKIQLMNNNNNFGEIGIQSDGRILVCGSEGGDTLGATFSALVARYVVTGAANPKNVAVISPNGAENYNAVSNQTVLWNSTGVNKVNVYYKINNGPLVNIASNINNTGSTPWTTPSIASNKYKIIIQDATDWSILDTSDTNFTVSIPSTTGIDEQSSGSVVTLFPSPANTHIDIKVDAEVPVEIRILNELGLIVYEGSFLTTSRVNTSDYKSGIYFVSLFNKDFYLTKKIIVLHD